MQIAAAPSARYDVAHFGCFIREVPRQRRRQVDRLFIRLFRKYSDGRIVERDAELALIFAGELTHFERSRFCRCFPIDVPSRILGHVFANAIEIGTSSADEALPLAAY